MIYRFGDFTVDTNTRQLLFNNDEVHLSPKAFELLTVLLADRHRAVSKAELQKRIWPSTFVEETNLASLVAEVRHALRDSASSPAFVRTVYGFGYSFVGEVIMGTAATRSGVPRQKPFLVFENRTIVLMEGNNVIGRAPDITIQIDSPGVSRNHAQILVSQGEATLEDLGSKNGTYVNGKRITTSTRLSDGDEIRLGAIVLAFRIAPSTGPTETVQAGGA